MSITFENLSGPIYPAYLRVGDYSIALEPELIASLKKLSSEENSRFLELITEKVGINRYLKTMIQKGIKEEGDQAALVLKLRETLASL